MGLALDLEDYHPSVLLHCWLGDLTCKIVSEMTYNVLSGTLNPTIQYHMLSVTYCAYIYCNVPYIIGVKKALNVTNSALTVANFYSWFFAQFVIFKPFSIAVAITMGTFFYYISYETTFCNKFQDFFTTALFFVHILNVALHCSAFFSENSCESLTV